jgi:hypothetical protein
LYDLISSTRRCPERITEEINRTGKDKNIIETGIFIIGVTNVRSFHRYTKEGGIAIEKAITIIEYDIMRRIFCPLMEILEYIKSKTT